MKRIGIILFLLVSFSSFGQLANGAMFPVGHTWPFTLANNSI